MMVLAGFKTIQYILSASCYDGYGAKLTQLLLVLSGDVELNPGPFNRDEDIGEYNIVSLARPFVRSNVTDLAANLVFSSQI